MLKGILFIIAIIVTFDIGKTLIHSWNEHEEVEKTPELLQPEQPMVKSVEPSTVPRQEKLDLSLPDDVQFEEEDAALPASGKLNIQPGKSPNRTQFSGKPIIIKETPESKPELGGVSVGIKVDL